MSGKLGLPHPDGATATMLATAGTPLQIGEQWGRVHRQAIQSDLEVDFLAPAAANAIARDQLAAQADRFGEICTQIAPHWLEELAALSCSTRPGTTSREPRRPVLSAARFRASSGTSRSPTPACRPV